MSFLSLLVVATLFVTAVYVLLSIPGIVQPTWMPWWCLERCYKPLELTIEALTTLVMIATFASYDFAVALLANAFLIGYMSPRWVMYACQARRYLRRSSSPASRDD